MHCTARLKFAHQAWTVTEDAENVRTRTRSKSRMTNRCRQSPWHGLSVLHIEVIIEMAGERYPLTADRRFSMRLCLSTHTYLL